MSITPKTLINEFLGKYESKYDQEYFVSSLNTTLAARIAPYYGLAQVRRALDFYFEHYQSNELNDFINKLDVILKELQTTEKSKQSTDELVKETKRVMREIENGN